jgi:hypothetical protein
MHWLSKSCKHQRFASRWQSVPISWEFHANLQIVVMPCACQKHGFEIHVVYIPCFFHVMLHADYIVCFFHVMWFQWHVVPCSSMTCNVGWMPCVHDMSCVFPCHVVSSHVFWKAHMLCFHVCHVLSSCHVMLSFHVMFQLIPCFPFV